MKSKLRFVFLLVAITILSSFSLNPKAFAESELLKLINEDREVNGLPKLSFHPVLNLAAYAKANDMLSENYFAHTSPAGETPWHWFEAVGYRYTFAGENLAKGFDDPVDLEKSWMASTSHRANILSPNYSEVGLAVVSHQGQNLVVQLFGSQDQKLTLVDREQIAGNR